MELNKELANQYLSKINDELNVVKSYLRSSQEIIDDMGNAWKGSAYDSNSVLIKKTLNNGFEIVNYIDSLNNCLRDYVKCMSENDTNCGETIDGLW